MTHLKIELPVGLIEYVSDSAVEKLYEAVTNSVLDNESNLQGAVHVNVGYRDHIDEITTRYPDFHVWANDYAILFEDPNMVTYLNSIGVGSNGIITEALAAAATAVANSTNTSVTKFNELKYFTNITQSRGGLGGSSSGDIRFGQWTSLQEVDISNFTSIGHIGTGALYETFAECSALTKVTASSKLTSIGTYAFCECPNLTTITGLSGVITIYGTSSFFGCSSLASDNFSNVRFAFDQALKNSFYGCSALTNITLDSSVTTLPLSCFAECTSLLTINLANITTLPDKIGNYGVFTNCTSLASADLSNCTYIGSRAFFGCSSLTSVNLNSCTNLGQEAFTGCTSLTSIDLSNCTTILHGAFKGCTSLTSVDISNMTNSTNSYSNGIFQDCTSLQTVIFPTVLLHNSFMFYGCTSLGVNEDLDITLDSYSQRMFRDTGYRTVTLHCHNQNLNSWTTGNLEGAFCTMPNVTKLDFSDTTMPHYTLSNNTNLTTLILPTTYSTVFWNTFSGSNNLLYIVILATTPPTLSDTTYMLHGNYHPNANVYVPDAVVADYKAASGWNNILDRIKGISELPSSVTWYTKEHPST